MIRRLFRRSSPWLMLVLAASLFFRVYRLNEFPTGLNADEAAIGYNAYSLLQTGKDEFGHPWPVNFQSFNDWKPGLYFYLVLPMIKLVGLNEWAVRLPSALLGTLTVLLVYLLVKHWSRNQGWAILAAAVLALNPWPLHFSRGGWESNAALFFLTLGVYLFFVSLKNPKIFAFCLLPFVLSLYTYHSARLIAPLLVAGIVLLNFKKTFTRLNARYLLLTVLLASVLLAPVIFSLKGEAGVARFAGVGLLADQGPYWRANELRGQHPDTLALLPTVLHNRYFEYALRFIDNYLRHYSGDYLFISGDEIQRNRVPETGQLLLVNIPLLAVGIYFLLNQRPTGWRELLWWLAVAPTASALTFQSPHAIRSLSMVVPLALIVGYGAYQLLIVVKNRIKIRLYLICLTAVFVLAYAWNFAFYLHQYYGHYPQTYPTAWEDGFRDLTKVLTKEAGKYQQVYVTNKYDQPYILLAFYLRYPPAEFQKEAKLSARDRFGFSTVESLGKYRFGEIVWSATYPPGSLLVGTANEIPNDATIVKRVYFKDGVTEAFRLAEK